ncbi:hypothetical protein PHISCL_07935 [Aspergillus sclerotialis]|uniref:Uncharacterized protein n=1 Tax=Aspergillus sclerotialis TaxID=2070753 RepID=A0A3A2Z9C4_9EURO|nr:hypothetical protein PHISCL_07935 [Aspergillus sclerotialis]
MSPRETSSSESEDDIYSDIDNPGEPSEPPSPFLKPAFDYNQCRDAIKGLAVPDDLSSTTARCAVIRGIRSNYDFATSNAVVELSSSHPEIARACNARFIMSNQVPNLLTHTPYCIWYPDLATEVTYREVAHSFPALRYHVGRACAAAGYIDLYQELDLRPDIAIAEEARESGTEGGEAIFRIIMVAPIKFQIMDDLHRTITPETQVPAFLNGDTVVRWILGQRYPLPRQDSPKDALPVNPDIEEDCRLAEEEVSLPKWRVEYTYDEAKLLFTPLPRDLPTMKKDLLIQMAAYEGNIDRYARLMRPDYMTEEEEFCVVRGIFHHTMFARWWADQLTWNKGRIRTRDSTEAIRHISEAVNARRVMINDISGLTDESPYLPYMIWWPLRPTKTTLQTLAKQCPRMTHQIAITCVLSDYGRLYRELCVKPHYHIWLAARRSPNPFYRQDLETRSADLGFDVTYPACHWTGATDSWLAEDLEPTSDLIYSPLNPFLMADGGQRVGPYFEYTIKSGIVERYVFQRPELLRRLEAEGHVCQGSLEWLEEDDT